MNGREGTDENDLVFIVPRNDNTLIVESDFSKFSQMLDWYTEFYPSLKYSEMDSERMVALSTGLALTVALSARRWMLPVVAPMS